MIRTALRVLHVVMAGLFAWSAYLQHNDPDPLPWMAVYLTALVVALTGAIGVPLRWQSAALAGIAFMWAMALLPAVPVWADSRVRTTFYMHTGDDVEEEARECGGLLIVTFWSLVTLVDANTRLRRSPKRSAA